jgi:hypothetical protein
LISSLFFGPSSEGGLAKLVQGRLHFVAGMNVTRLLGDNYAVRKGSACFIKPTETGEELPELEVSSHIRWVIA